MTTQQNDKFLLSYAVAKRAKEIAEEGIYYLPEEEQDHRPIMQAIKEISQGKIKINITDDKKVDLKEEEDTLDLLYDTMKLPEDDSKMAEQKEVAENQEQDSDDNTSEDETSSDETEDADTTDTETDKTETDDSADNKEETPSDDQDDTKDSADDKETDKPES